MMIRLLKHSKTPSLNLLLRFSSKAPNYETPTPTPIPQSGETSSNQLSLTTTPSTLTTEALLKLEREALLKCVEEQCRTGKLGNDEAFHLFNQLIQLEPTPPVFYFNQISGSLLKNNQFQSVHFMLSFIYSNTVGVRPNFRTHSTRISCFARMGSVYFAMGAMGGMVKSGFEPGRYELNSIIDSLSRVGKPTEGLDLLNKMQNIGGFECNAITYGFVIKGFCRLNNCNMALSLLQTMELRGVMPDIFNYNMVIYTLCKEGRLDAAATLYKKMLGKGIKPDIVTCNSFVNVLLKLDEFKRVTSLIREMDVKWGVVIDVRTLNSFVDKFSRIGDFKKAFMFRDYMISNGIKPDIYTYTSLIHGLACSERETSAVQVFKEMFSQGVVPEITTYNALLTGYCQQGLVKEANQIISFMIQRGITPDRTTYTCLISGYLWREEEKEAREVWELMERGGCNPDEVTYTVLINHHCKTKDLDKAMRVFREMRSKGFKVGIVTYNALLGGLARVNGFKTTVEEVLNDMADQGVRADPISYLALTMMYCSRHGASEALDLVDEMKRGGWKADIKIYTIIIQWLFRMRKPREAKELFDVVCKKEVHLDSFICGVMIEGLCTFNMEKCAASLLIKMEQVDLLEETDVLPIDHVVKSILESSEDKDLKLLQFLHARNITVEPEILLQFFHFVQKDPTEDGAALRKYLLEVTEIRSS